MISRIDAPQFYLPDNDKLILEISDRKRNLASHHNLILGGISFHNKIVFL